MAGTGSEGLELPVRRCEGTCGDGIWGLCGRLESVGRDPCESPDSADDEVPGKKRDMISMMVLFPGGGRECRMTLALYFSRQALVSM